MNYKSTIKNFEKNYDEKHTTRLKDMDNRFKDQISIKENPIIYRVFIKKFSPINLGLTVINPGAINKEFFMTKGHIHTKKTPEFYILFEGSGLLLIQKNNKQKTIKLKKEEITLIPEDYVHRLINIGNKKLKVLTIYHENSKPDYNIRFKKKFFKE